MQQLAADAKMDTLSLPHQLMLNIAQLLVQKPLILLNALGELVQLLLFINARKVLD